ncbi:Gibberellin 3-beta-dioxygenase 1 [Sesamum alatum]|uniref:gibberellin 3beta-dioxygenase n=1 Tax=Sesamum alatum TaxID=300844 RepID=A0AAE1XM27_9LAMI|nr:Gibberellin 3-beta-dioxygenase 1 [Sesamum alatum]
MSSPLLSDAFRARPLNLNHKIVDLSSVEILPDSHAWTFEANKYNSSCRGNMSNLESIPIIDLNDENAKELIGLACKNWGVFHAINHNVPKNLIDEVELAGERLFSLPMHQKLLVERTPNSMSGYGVVRISSFFSKLMWSEGFTIVGSPLEHAAKLWPHDYHKFCDTIEEYQKEMKNLASRLMGLMLGSLGVTKDDVKWVGAKDEPKERGPALQLNSYPPCPDPNRAMGMAAHTDSTILNILHQSNTSGLQVFRGDNTGWTTVQPHPGALVILLGDLMHILSNGSYLNPLHRAFVNLTQHRLSMVYLHGPPSSVKISPLPQLVDHHNPPLYRPATWSEYLGIKAQYFDKALTTIRLRNEFMDTDDDDSVKID